MTIVVGNQSRDTRMLFKLPREMHQNAKILAVMQGISFAELIRRAVRDYLAAHNSPHA